jgi:hypothetical protein
MLDAIGYYMPVSDRHYIDTTVDNINGRFKVLLAM